MFLDIDYLRDSFGVLVSESLITKLAADLLLSSGERSFPNQLILKQVLCNGYQENFVGLVSHA